MMTEQKQAWLQFRAVRFRGKPGVPAGEFHPETQVCDRREVEEYARQAFEAGFRAAQGQPATI